MVRRSSRLQAGNYYAVSNSHSSIPVASISYYETPIRYVRLNSYVWNASRHLSTNICVFLFPAGVPKGPVSKPPDRRVFRRPLLKASVNVRGMSGLGGVMLSPFSSSFLIISPPSSGLQPESGSSAGTGCRSRIPDFFFTLKRQCGLFTCPHSNSLCSNFVFPPAAWDLV